MVFAVAHVDGTVGIDENPVRASQVAFQWVGFRTVAAHARAGDEFHRALFHLEHPDGMAFGIGEVNVPVGSKAEAFWAGKRGGPGRTAIAGKSLRARAGNVVERA